MSTQQMTALQAFRSLVETAEAGVDALSQIPSYLADARKERGLTQRDLARRLSVVQSNVADIEKGRTIISAERARKILDAIMQPSE